MKNRAVDPSFVKKYFIKAIAYVLFFILFFHFLLIISVFLKPDWDVCLDSSICKKGLTVNHRYYTFLINEKSCEIMNGIIEEEYCNLNHHPRPCDGLLWDTINNKCTEILPDEIVNDPTVVVGKNEEKIKEYLENQALKNN